METTKEKKQEQRTGIIFEHRFTGRPALYITQYDPSWKDSPNICRVRCAEDIPNFTFNLDDLTIASMIYETQSKRGLYCHHFLHN